MCSIKTHTHVVWSGSILQADRIQILRGCLMADLLSTSQFAAKDANGGAWKERRKRVVAMMQALDGEGYTCPPVEKELSDDAIIVCIYGDCICEDDANILAHAVKLYGLGNSETLLKFTGYSAKHSNNLAQELIEPVAARLHAIAVADYDVSEEIPQ